jgi:hypothetical protein
MENNRVVKKLSEYELISTRLAAKSTRRGENDIKEYLRIMKINN